MIVAVALEGVAMNKLSESPFVEEQNGLEFRISRRFITLPLPDRIHSDNHESTKAIPLVLMLHGGGGTSSQASRMGTTGVAEEYGFIVVYPNAVNKHGMMVEMRLVSLSRML